MVYRMFGLRLMPTMLMTTMMWFDFWMAMGDDMMTSVSMAIMMLSAMVTPMMMASLKKMMLPVMLLLLLPVMMVI